MTGVGEVLVSPIIGTTNSVVNGTLAGTQKLGRWRRRLVGISARSLGFGAPSTQRSLLGGGDRGRTKWNEVITTVLPCLRVRRRVGRSGPPIHSGL